MSVVYVSTYGFQIVVSVFAIRPSSERKTLPFRYIFSRLLRSFYSAKICMALRLNAINVITSPIADMTIFELLFTLFRYHFYRQKK